MPYWSGFQLSPLEHSSQTRNLDGAQTVSGECFELPPGSTSNHFGIMEAFNSGHQHQGADYFSMDGMEQYNICNQNLCTLGNKFGGQSYVNQQNLSQFNDVSLRSQSFGNPSDGGEGGGSMNGCLLASSANRGGQSSSAKNNMNIVVSGLDGQNASSSEIVVPRKTVDTF